MKTKIKELCKTCLTCERKRSRMRELDSEGGEVNGSFSRRVGSECLGNNTN